MKTYSIIIIYIIILFSSLSKADTNVSHAIAMHGLPKYNSEFQNVEYVNPMAPKGGKVILVGGPGEEKVGEDLYKKLIDIDPINLVGKPILPTAAIFSLSRIFIGNDSGLMHLSAATGAPTLGLFGPTDDKLYSPTGKNALFVRTPQSPQELMDIPNFNHRTSSTLMDTLTVKMVENRVKDLLLNPRWFNTIIFLIILKEERWKLI